MDIYLTALEIIDFRSFSNLWFWIVLAVFWSTTSHFVMGVPYDLVTRSAREGQEDAETDLHDLVRINTKRLLYIVDTSGVWLVGLVAFNLVSIWILGFVYGAEFFQAIFLLLGPMTLVFALTIRNARSIREKRGDELRHALRKHRFIVQLIGMFSIFVTSMWGITYNLHFNVLGS